MPRSLARYFCVFAGLPLVWITACGTDMPVATEAGVDEQTEVEKVLDVRLGLSGTTLRISVRDGDNPVMTDAWLYTLKDGNLTPLIGFQDPDSKRRYRGLMMPCTLAGAPSKLVPCDDGALNGVMTDSIREKVVNGVRSSAIDGAVDVTLDAAPADPVVVVVAREDQRYAGAAAINPDGQKATVPTGVGAPEAHRVVTYAKDIAPILSRNCVSCHKKSGAVPDLPLDTYDSIVTRDFGYARAEDNCKQMFPADPAQLKACTDAITRVEYFIEPGNPAVGGLMRRTRPDEEKSVSTVGLVWYGSKGSRFGAHGDRRMPPSNITMDTSDDLPIPTYFDMHPKDYQLVWDWVSQGGG